MPKQPVPKCYMCDRKAKTLTAERDGQTYIHAQNITIFCSLKCAANYGLLWGTPEINETRHYCPTTSEWEWSHKDECRDCQFDEQANTMKGEKDESTVESR